MSKDNEEIVKPRISGTYPIKEGTVLIAVDPCVMQHSGEASLTIGKEYVVRSIGNWDDDMERDWDDDDTQFEVIDDDDDLHIFDIYNYERYFKIKPSL